MSARVEKQARTALFGRPKSAAAGQRGKSAAELYKRQYVHIALHRAILQGEDKQYSTHTCTVLVGVRPVDHVEVLFRIDSVSAPRMALGRHSVAVGAERPLDASSPPPSKSALAVRESLIKEATWRRRALQEEISMQRLPKVLLPFTLDERADAPEFHILIRPRDEKASTKRVNVSLDQMKTGTQPFIKSCLAAWSKVCDILARNNRLEPQTPQHMKPSLHTNRRRFSPDVLNATKIPRPKWLDEPLPPPKQRQRRGSTGTRHMPSEVERATMRFSSDLHTKYLRPQTAHQPLKKLGDSMLRKKMAIRAQVLNKGRGWGDGDGDADSSGSSDE
jgi:hypothetical protein